MRVLECNECFERKCGEEASRSSQLAGETGGVDEHAGACKVEQYLNKPWLDAKLPVTFTSSLV